jgi:hypothetical protein
MTIKTKVRPGRDFLRTEQDAVELRLSEAVAAGTTDGAVTREPLNDPALRTATRVWSTLEAANDWIAFINTFTPAPVSAEVVEE